MKLLFSTAALFGVLLFNAQFESCAATWSTWRQCQNNGHIVSMKGSTFRGAISTVIAKCNGGDELTYSTNVFGQMPSVTQIQGPAEGFADITEWHNSNTLTCLAVAGYNRINNPKGASSLYTCDKDQVICGFRVKTDYNYKVFQDMEWKCCGTPGVHGDPQFIGFMGQSFQVHGMDNTVYNIISTPKFQFNALFTYLSKGECRQGTLCFSHPGNYFGKVAVSLKTDNEKVHQLLIEAGPVKEGMKVQFDGVEVLPSQKHLTIDDSTQLYFPSVFECYIEGAEFSLKLENSDMFLNQQVTVNSELMKRIAEYKQAAAKTETESQSLVSDLLASSNSVNEDNNTADTLLKALPHGILGQTWLRKEYNNRWKHIEGQLYDYIVSDGFHGKQFKYNRF